MIDRLERQLGKEARDLRILEAVVRDHPVGIVRLAEATDVPKHKVRYSLRMLENDGFIEPTPQGAVPADDITERIETVNDGLDGLVDRLEAIQAD